MAVEVAGLYTTLTAADEEFIAACARDETALEGVAATSEETTATVAAGAKKRTTAAGEEAAATERSTTRQKGAWAGLTSAIEHHGSTTTQVWNKVTKIGEASAIGLLAIGAESVNLASKFQSAMELVHTQAGASQQEVDSLGKSVLALAPTVGIGPEKLAEGLYHVESAGFRGQQALDILASSAKTAAIGQSDLESTTQALIGTMAAGLKDVNNAADAGAYLNTIVGIGDMRMEKLAASISTGVLPSFKAAGLGMADYGAALATLTDNVTPADEAASRLRMTVSLMASPSLKASNALKDIGLSSTQLAADMRKPDGLLIAVQDLKNHLEATYPSGKKVALTAKQVAEEVKKYSATLSAAGIPVSEQSTLIQQYTDSLHKNGLAAVEQNQKLQQIFGGGRTSGAMLTLIGESDRLSDKYKELGDAGSRAARQQDAWAATQKTFKQSSHELGAQLQVIGVNVGNFVLPYLTKLTGFLASHQGVLKTFFIVLVAGMTAFTIAVIANTVAMLANPVVWIVIAIVAAVALLALGIYELVKHWSTVWGFIKKYSLIVWNALVVAWQATWNAVKAVVSWIDRNIIKPVVGFFEKYLVTPVRMWLNVLVKVWQFVWGFMSVVIGDFVRVWKFEWSIVQAFFKAVWDNYLKPVFDAINTYGIKPVQAAIHWLAAAWDAEWKVIKKVAGDAWDFLKVIWGYVKRDGIDKVVGAVGWLRDEWKQIWGEVTGVLQSAWDKYIKPITDKISSAFSSIKKIFGAIANSPGDAGKAFAKMLGFADGGWVPGSPGQAQLAVVHGGEFVVSQAMLRGGGPGAVRASAPTLPGGGGTQVIENHTHVYLDGKEIQQANMRQAQRHKLRNSSSGLT